MKIKQLIDELWELSRKIEHESWSKAFISNSETVKWYWRLVSILGELWSEWIQIESIVENWIQFCWSCRQKVSLRKKRIDKAMVSALIKSFNFVIAKQEQTFQIQEIWFTPIEYWVVNHLVRFGLLYKNWDFWQWVYWVPRKTVSQFLSWKWNVAEYYETDPTKQEWEEWRRVMSEKRIYISEIPSVSDLQKEYWKWLTQYEWNENFE